MVNFLQVYNYLRYYLCSYLFAAIQFPILPSNSTQKHCLNNSKVPTLLHPNNYYAPLTKILGLNLALVTYNQAFHNLSQTYFNILISIFSCLLTLISLYMSFHTLVSFLRSTDGYHVLPKFLFDSSASGFLSSHLSS